MTQDNRTGLSPRAVFRAFEAISAIPRGSGKERAVSDYLLDFARNLGLTAVQDKTLNIIVKKPGTPGYENAPTVILQGHMDMVWEKRDDSPHCFETDPIRLVIDGDRLHADGTTLGADNGIAVAYAMALLESSDIPHPPLEVLITTEEEVGLLGAAALSPDALSGKILINMDSEEEGEFTVSCAGGSRCVLSLPINPMPVPQTGHDGFDLEISGLKGGHSGMDIHLGRASANVLMADLLHAITDLSPLISEISGGTMANAISRTARAKILVPCDKSAALAETIMAWEKDLDFGQTDPDINVLCTPSHTPCTTVMAPDAAGRAVALIRSIPTGVRSMSPDMEGLVESSLNLGIVAVRDTALDCHYTVRSGKDALMAKIRHELETAAQNAGAQFRSDSAYPAWEYRKDSPLRELFKETFQELYGKAPLVTSIHAGLECGILGDILGDVDMISMGPDMFHVHTPDEYLSIGSVQRTWELLLLVLKKMRTSR